MVEILEKFNRLLASFKKHQKMSVRSLEDIKKIPITTRQDLLVFSLQDSPVRTSFIYNTSGTEGANSLVFYSDERFWAAAANRFSQLLSEIGLKPEKEVILNITDIPMAVFISPDKLDQYFTVCQCGKYESSKKLMLEYDMNRIKPTVILAFPQVLNNFIDDIPKDNFTTIKKVLLTGQPINTFLREKIHKYLPNAEIHMIYGTTEVAFFAIQEKETDFYMRMVEEELYFEIFRDNNSFQEGTGKLLVSDFSNFSMPIIRYNQGDIVEIKNEHNKRYIKYIGRKDSYAKINGDLISKEDFADVVLYLLRNSHFRIQIKQDEKLNDFFVLEVEKKDRTRALLVKIAFKKRYDIETVIEDLKEPVKVTYTGKTVNVIDTRQGNNDPQDSS